MKIAIELEKKVCCTVASCFQFRSPYHARFTFSLWENFNYGHYFITLHLPYHSGLLHTNIMSDV